MLGYFWSVGDILTIYQVLAYCITVYIDPAIVFMEIIDHPVFIQNIILF
jgi:hypothetical protein